MRFAFVDGEKANHSVLMLWKHALDDARLGTLVVAAHRAGRGTYGSPRVLRELREGGESTSRKRVARLLRERGLSGQPQKRWRHRPGDVTTAPMMPNVLDRGFSVAAPDKVWAGYITYIWTWEG